MSSIPDAPQISELAGQSARGCIFSGRSPPLFRLLWQQVIALTLTTCCVCSANAYDLDPHYKFSAPKATASPLKNTWGAFQTQLFTGSFGYEYTFAVPPGINGLTPKLSLSYNSHSAKGKPGWVGAGWEIPLSFVQRDIEYTRTNTGDDTFDLHLDGAKHDLIYVSAENRFHTKVESYLKVEQLTGAPNERGEYWLVTDRGGTSYRFGYNLDSEHRIAATDAAVNYIWRWSLDRIEDTNGNTINLKYSENPTPSDSGAVYLSRIEYNNDRQRRIDFDLETTDRPDSFLAIEQGSEVREARRLKEIRVTVAGSLARKYVLDYAMNGAGNKSLLTTITQFGSDGTTALPPVRFAYKGLEAGFPDEQTWTTPSNRWIREVDGDSDTVGDVFDVNGDGLQDLVSFDANHWDVWYGDEMGFAATAVQWSDLVSTPIRQVNCASCDGNTESADTKSSPMDINRDGFVDFVHAAESLNSLDVRLGNGSGFAALQNWWGGWLQRISVQEVENPGKPVVRAPNVYQEFFDINGDSLPDLVESEGGGPYVWHIWRNTGSGFTEYGSWSVPHSSGYLWDYTKDVPNLEIGHFDMNGDGLDDIVDSAGGDWLIYLNTGSGFLPALTWATGFSGLIRDPDPTGNVKRDLFDINGDGLPDIVNPPEDLPEDGIRTWDVRLNNGYGFGPIIRWLAPSTGPFDGYTRDVTTDGNVQRDLIDMNGDGVPDIVRKTEDVWQVAYNRSGMADLLTQVTDTLGGVVEVTYSSSRAFQQSRLPFNFWVATSITKHNGMTGAHAQTSTTQYSYEQGLYDFPSREFRGFGQVKVTRPDGGRETHLFHQDEGRKGNEREVAISDAAGQPYATTRRNWVDSVGNGIYVARLVQNEELTHDGVVAGPKMHRTEFENHDNFGNVGLEKRLGDPDTTADDAFFYREFAINPEQWIVDRVAHLRITAGADGTRLRESWFAYDASTTGTPPTKGNLTHEEQYLEGGNAVTRHEYDAYGNRIRTIDAEGHSSSTQFDGTFQTFPRSVTNAKGQVTQRLYNPVNGEILEETDPNGFKTQFLYDIFQRKAAEIRPYDSVAQPTMQIQYDLDGIAPERILTSRRAVSGQSGTLDSTQFVDGFGSLIQTRSEPASGTAWITEDLFYDSMDHLWQRSNPYLVGEGDAYATPVTTTPATTYDYDVMGRPVRVTNPDGSQVSRSFDHWAVTETDENGHHKSYQFDALQRLLQVVEENTGETYTTRYGYDAAGQLRDITDHPGNVTTIIYDSLGRKTAMSDPDLGAWSYAYDRVGNLVSQTDARGITTLFSYDVLNRKTLVDYPRDQDIIYSYDQGTIGTLSQVNEALGTTSYQYDQRLRKITEQRVMDTFSWTTTWQYDALDRVTLQTNPDGQLVQYDYNARGLLESIPGVVTALEYDASGRVSRKAYANTRETTYSYHPQNLRLTRIFSAGIQDLNYTYDAVGNVTTIGDGVAMQTETFGYDALDRLTSAEDGRYNRQYTYNAIGNMMEIDLDGFDSVYEYGSLGSRPHAVTSMTLPGIRIESMVLAAGSEYTLRPEVPIDAVVLGAPTEYLVSEKADFAGADWQPLTKTPTIAFGAGYGRRTVYFKVRNGTEESNVKFDSINYSPDADRDGGPDHMGTDIDMDGMPDAWELQHGLDPGDTGDALLDPDNDGLNNQEEFRHTTDPLLDDTDSDGVKDGSEVHSGLNPNDPDTDHDGIGDALDNDPTNASQPPASEMFSVRGGRLNSGGGQRSSANLEIALDSLGEVVNSLSVQAALQMEPSLHQFGIISLGSASEPVTFTLRNIDSIPHIINQIVFLGVSADNYLKTEDECTSLMLPAGEQCQFKGSFIPHTLGLKVVTAGVVMDNGVQLATAELHGQGGDDSDNDGMSDAFERARIFDPYDPADAALDADGDGISNRAEFESGSNPRTGTPPLAPTIGTASVGNASILVNFGAPTSNGSAEVTGYSATCTSIDGGVSSSNTGDASATSIWVSGLTNGKGYTCTVTASNSEGPGPASAASNGVTPFDDDGFMTLLPIIKKILDAQQNPP